jgi:hypothetical protein
MSFAIGFVAFREWQLKVDTIPKPVGLGSRCWREGAGCSVFVRAHFCSANVRLCKGRLFRISERVWTASSKTLSIASQRSLPARA